MNSKVLLSQIRRFKKLFNKYCDGLRDLEKAKALGVPYQVFRINSLNIGFKDKPLEIQSSDLLKTLTTLKPYLIKIIANESINTLESAIT